MLPPQVTGGAGGILAAFQYRQPPPLPLPEPHNEGEGGGEQQAAVPPELAGRGVGEELAVIVDDGLAGAERPPLLPLYSGTAAPRVGRGGSGLVHVVLAEPGGGPEMRDAMVAAGVTAAVLCRTLEEPGPADDARAIVGLQGHHNEGRLRPACIAVLGMGGEASG